MSMWAAFIDHWFVARPRKVYSTPFTNWLHVQAFLFILSALPTGIILFIAGCRSDCSWGLVFAVSLAATAIMLVLGVVAAGLSFALVQRLQAQDLTPDSSLAVPNNALQRTEAGGEAVSEFKP